MPGSPASVMKNQQNGVILKLMFYYYSCNLLTHH